MRLGEQEKRSGTASATVLRVALGLAIFVTGLTAGSEGWHRATAQQISAIRDRLGDGSRTSAMPVLTVDMPYEEYSVLLRQREQALNTGVYLSSEEGFVPAAAHIGNTAVEVQMQLKEGAALDLGPNDKWAFEGRIAEGSSPGSLEFDRFFLQDPTGDSWWSRWAFSEAMQQEGLMTARYRLVRLVFNGDDRGVYACLEGYSRSLTASQGHPPGIIVAFDTEPLWESVAQFGGRPEAAFADPVSNLSIQDFRTLGIETLDLATDVDMGTSLTETGKALNLLYGLQTSQNSASKVFDADQYGRFLALIDLWGATQATSPLHLQYYYNTVADRLEPVIVDAQALDTDDRLSLTTAFGDPYVQTAYVREASRISQPAYLERLQQQLTESWQRISDALQAELPDLEPRWDDLAERQAMLQRSLNPGHPILAYVRSPAGADNGALGLDIANVINLPVEILGFDLDGATFVDADATQITSTSAEILDDLGEGVVIRAASLTESATMQFTYLELPLDRIHRVDSEADFSQDLDIRVAVRLLGSEHIQMIPVSLELATSPEGSQPW